MNCLLLISCIAIITGLFNIFHLRFVDFAHSIISGMTEEKSSLRDKVKLTVKDKKEFFLIREIKDVKRILELIGKGHRLNLISTVCIALFATGAGMSIIIGNIFLIPVLAVGLMMIPLWYIKLTEHSFKKAITNELETTLSVITTAYIRTEDIITAIDENIDYLNEPIKSVFNTFLFSIKHISPDINSGISHMKASINNPVFKEWCDAISACTYDRNLKNTLIPIVSKLSDMRIVNAELDNIVFEPRKEFITMAVMLLGNFPLLYFLNKDWFNILTKTIAGQVVTVICITATLISTAFVIKLTKPIEYRR